MSKRFALANDANKRQEYRQTRPSAGEEGEALPPSGLAHVQFYTQTSKFQDSGAISLSVSQVKLMPYFAENYPIRRCDG